MSKKISPSINPINSIRLNPNRIINKEYLNSLKDIYICPICKNILTNPTDCEECGHSFCNDCIMKNECPFKCKKKILKQSSMAIKNMLNKLIFKCENKGCNEEIPYLNVKSHDETCPFLIITCPNEKCGKKLPKKDLEKHIKNECKYALIQCKYCKFLFPKNKINEHENICNKAYRSLTGDRTIDFGEIDTKKYLEALSMNISRMLKDNNVKSFVGNNDKFSFGLNENENSKEINEGSYNLKSEVLGSNIKEEISTNVKDNLNHFEKNIENLNENISQIKTLVTSLKSLNKNIINETNFNLSQSLNNQDKEIIKEILNGNYNYIEQLINKMEKNVKSSLKNLNVNIINIFNEKKPSNEIIKKYISESHKKISNINIDKKTETKITNKIIKEGITYVPEEYFRNKLAQLIKLIEQTNFKIEGFKVSFTTDIQEYTENLENIISITATVEQSYTEFEIEETLDENGHVIEKKEIRNPAQRSYRSLSFIHLNENNFKELQNNIQKIVDENNKRNFEQMKLMYEKEMEERKKENEEYFSNSDDEDIETNIKKEKIVDNKKKRVVKKINKEIEEVPISYSNNFNINGINNINLIQSLENNKELLNKQKNKIIDEMKNNNEEIKINLQDTISNGLVKVSKGMTGINTEIDIIKTNINEIQKIMNEEFNDISKLINENKINKKKNNYIKEKNENKFIHKDFPIDDNKIEYITKDDNIDDNKKELISKNILIDNNKKESNYLKEKRKYKLSKKSREIRSGPSNDEIIKNIDTENPKLEEYLDNEIHNKKKSNIIKEDIIEEENEDNKNETINIIKKNKNVNNIEETNINIVNNDNIQNNSSIDETKYNENNINDYSSLLNTLQKQINSFNTLTENIPSNNKLDAFKNSMIKEYDVNLLNFGKDIEENLNDKMKTMFSIKWCNDCEKIDYFYGFLPCFICKKENCKQCIILCTQCKHLICKKCGICPKCGKNICLNCRESPHKKSFDNCI